MNDSFDWPDDSFEEEEDEKDIRAILETTSNVISPKKVNVISPKKVVEEIQNIPDRIVVHIDLDCFFVQVEQHLQSNLHDTPYIAVVQHQDIIAVSYPARTLGVKKHAIISQAQQLCKGELVLVHVGKEYGSKVSYKRYKQASKLIFRCIEEQFKHIAQKWSSTHSNSNNNTSPAVVIEMEQASIDEVFVDITPLVNIAEVLPNQKSAQTSDPILSVDSASWKGIVEGLDTLKLGDRMKRRYQIADSLVHTIRSNLQTDLEYTASAGISCNKLLAKLASQQHKPNQQTILLPQPAQSWYHMSIVTHRIELLRALPLQKLPFIGSKVPKDKRAILEDSLKIVTVGDVLTCNPSAIANYIGKVNAEWLVNAAKGIDNSPVKQSGHPKSVMSSMSLTPITNNEPALRNVVGLVSAEFVERLTEQVQAGQSTKDIQFSYRLIQNKNPSSYTFPMAAMSALLGMLDDFEASSAKVTLQCMQIFNTNTADQSWTVRWIGVSAHFKTVEVPAQDKQSITTFFKNPPESANNNNNNNTHSTTPDLTKPTRQANSVPTGKATSNTTKTKGKKRKSDEGAPGNTLLKYFAKS